MLPFTSKSRLVFCLAFGSFLACSEAADPSASGTDVGGAASGGSSGGSGGSGVASGGAPASGGLDAIGGATGSGGASSGGGAQPSDGQGGGSGGHAAGGDSASGGSSPLLPPISDYSEEGPFDTVVETGQGPGDGYLVVRPEPLGEDGFLHAPIIFGPGIGQQASVHTAMLTNFASHGFVVVGTPALTGGPGDPANRQKMLDGLDWILAQNDVAGLYQGKLWTDHAVSMGFSVGGTSAVEVGGHSSVLTVVSIHGHTASADLHGTMLQTTGTLDPVGMPLQQATYSMSQVPTFLATLTGANHPYIEQNGGGEERPAIVAWLRYWIYGDTGAEHYFFGEDCVLCAPPWENPQRKNWP